MFRIDHPTAATSLPAPSAAGTPGWFTNGDAAAGQAATVLPADWLNMVQDELIALVAHGGLTPSKSNRTQVRDALVNAFGGGGTLGAQGWQRLPGGLYIQWGGGTTSASGSVTVTYPIAFPNACFGFYASDGASASSDVRAIGTTNVNRFGGNVYYATAEAGAFMWMALGN